MKAANIGKLLGVFGLVLVLSSPFTLFFTAGSALAAGVKAGAGALLLAFYFATNWQQFGQFSTRRSSFFVTSTVLMAAVTLGALVAINYIAYKKNKTWDLTTEKIYTLHDQTQGTLKGLKDKVRAVGFVPSTHPAYDYLQQLFERYQAVAPDKFEYSFKDPRRHPDLAAKYQLREGQATVVLTQGEGESESHTSLNAINEQELTNALIKLTKVGDQKVYFLVGHGEWPLDSVGAGQGGQRDASLSELKQQLLQEGYTVEAINLVGKTEVPRDAALVVVAGPKTRYSDPEVEALRKYLGQGGRMLYFAEAQMEPGLDKLLNEYGVQVDPGLAGDERFNGGHPFFIISLFYGDHEIAKPLERRQLNVELPTARSLSVLREGLAEGVQVVPVVLSSPFGWVETGPISGQVGPTDGEKRGQLTLAAAATRGTASAEGKRFDEARLVVVGDSELLLDANWGHEANRNLVLNALGWATNQVEKITIRPPDRATSTIQLEPELMAKIRFVATDLLPLSLLGLGLAIWLARRNQ